MGKEFLEINEYEMNDINAHLAKSSTNMEQLSNDLKAKFSDITSSGLLSKSTSKIDKQMKKIFDNINVMGKSVSRTYENIARGENYLSSKVQQIEVPQDFIINDSANEININVGMLNKADGIAVKNTSIQDNDIEFKNSLNYNSKLKNIIKEYEDINGEITINASRFELNDIKKDQVLVDNKISEFEDNTKNISMLKNNEIQISDNNVEISDIENKNISRIYNNSIKIDDYNDDMTFDKEILNKINKDINTNHPEFNDSFEINKVFIKNINNGQNTNNLKFNDDYHINKNNINRLNKIKIKINSYDDSYKNVKKMFLYKLNNGNYTLKNYDE